MSAPDPRPTDHRHPLPDSVVDRDSGNTQSVLAGLYFEDES